MYKRCANTCTCTMLLYYIIIFIRPHFSLDIDTKEEYFIELILSRHARDLLSSNCIRDLGMFASHLDFDLALWMSKERYNYSRDSYFTNFKVMATQFVKNRSTNSQSLITYMYMYMYMYMHGLNYN